MEDKTAITLKKMEIAWNLALDHAKSHPRLDILDTALKHFKTLYEGISAVVDENDVPLADSE